MDTYENGLIIPITIPDWIYDPKYDHPTNLTIGCMASLFLFIKHVVSSRSPHIPTWYPDICMNLHRLSSHVQSLVVHFSLKKSIVCRLAGDFPLQTHDFPLPILSTTYPVAWGSSLKPSRLTTCYLKMAGLGTMGWGRGIRWQVTHKTWAMLMSIICFRV